MDLTQVITWLVNSGGGTAVASWILEQIPWYGNLEVSKKRGVFFGVSVLITLLGYFAIMYLPPEWIEKATPIFGIVYASFASIFLGTGFHKVTKSPNEAPSDKDKGTI